MNLVTASQMQELDRSAIEEFAIPGIVLMENAGQGTMGFMLKELGPVAGKSAVIFCGPGNNGGDGLVIARIIHQLGGFPHIFLLTRPEKLSGDALTNYKIVSKLKIPLETIEKLEDIETVSAQIDQIQLRAPLWSLVDALFGTGLTRTLSGKFLSTVELINTVSKKFSCAVTAVDIPSGLSSDNGQILGGCCRADLTATYGFAKPGHYLHGGALVGKLKIIDIGIPPEAVIPGNLTGELLGPDIGRLHRERSKFSHKGNFGHLIIIGGSVGKTGAAILSGSGALHSGAGLVTLVVPNRLNPIFETSLPEAMTIPLQHSETFFSVADYEIILENIKGKSAIVLGPGIGTEPETEELVIKLYREAPIPMVIDADGLNILANNRECISQASGPRIFTPHPGEMARLLKSSSKIIQQDRLAAVDWIRNLDLKNLENAGRDHDLITVLKGAGTVCCDASGFWAINSSGNPGMATGGMGDVLSGLIGGLLAQGHNSWNSARIGVYLHGLAADLLAAKQPWGYLASDVARMLPLAMKQTFSTQS